MGCAYPASSHREPYRLPLDAMDETESDHPTVGPRTHRLEKHVSLVAGTSAVAADCDHISGGVAVRRKETGEDYEQAAPATTIE